MRKPRVAFICVHNSCRSQMAEAIAKVFASDTFDAFSAGTHKNDVINPDAVSTIKALYGVDMSVNQHPKLLETIPPVDIVITMGCNVECPFLPCLYREDWGLDDPTGKPEAVFHASARAIETRVRDLQKRIEKGLLKEPKTNLEGKPTDN